MRAKEMAPAGADLVVTRYTPSAGIYETFKMIVKRAGLTAWPKLMQNLRATRETELIAVYPIKDVFVVAGQFSAPIAMKHYAMTMQWSFERAIANGAGGVAGDPPQNPPQSMAKTGKGKQQPLEQSSENEKSPENPGFGGLGIAGENPNQYRRRDSNPHSLAGTGF